MTPYGIMNLVHNGPGNGLLPDSTKPLHDPIMTSHQYAPLWLISMLIYQEALVHVIQTSNADQ